MTGRKENDRMSGREPLMKEIAAESGVATRTLQRFRRGERISQPSQRRIEHVMQEVHRAKATGLTASDADPVLALRESYETMPFELRSGLDGLFPIVGFFTLVTSIGLWAATYQDGTNSPTKDALFAGTATATVILFAVWYLLPAMRRRRSRAMGRARSCAEDVLAGIRSGRVGRLSNDDRAMVVHQVGEAALVRDLERSPVGVRVDPF